MKITAANYDEARGLAEDPELDAGLRSELRAELSAYEKRQMTGGGFGATPRMQTSLEALETGGFHKPKSREEWSKNYRLRKEGGAALDKETARQIDEGMTQAYLEDNPENSVVVPTQAPVPLRQEFYENAREMVGPEEAANWAKAWGYEPEKEDRKGATVVNGDPRAAYLKRAEEAGEADKFASGEASLDDTLPSASKRTDLYAPPEFMPKGVSFVKALTAGYFEEPPLELAKQALRPKLGEAADQLTEESDQYKRFADAMWRNTYEEAEKAGRPVVRIKYMNTDDWVGKAAQLSARALGSAMPFAEGVDRSLTGGFASEALAGGLEKATGSKDIRSGMHASAEAHPGLTAAGAVAGALNPRGLAARSYSSVAGAIAPGASTIGRRLLGAAAGGMAAGAVSSAAPDIAYNTGEALFSENPHYRRPGDIATNAALSTGMGGLFGPAGELIGSGAGRAVRALREGRRGAALADLEQAGMTTDVLRGARRTPELAAVEREAALNQRHPEDVMVDRVAEPVGAEALRRQDETVARLAGENQAYSHGAGSRQISTRKILDQVDEEIRGLTQNGRPLPGRENDVRVLRDYAVTLRQSGQRMNADQLKATIEGLSQIVDRGAEYNPAPFKRVLKSAMDMAEDFPKPGEPAMRKGNISVQDNLRAMMMRHDVELQGVRARNEGAGLPRNLSPRPETANAPGPTKPQLSPNEEQAFRRTIAKYRSADTREARDDALMELAGGAGVEDELKMIAGSNAFKEVKEAARPRSVLGARGTMSMYAGNPLEVLGIRADPIMRGLAAREPVPISPKLAVLLKQAAGKSRSLNPLEDIIKGTRGRGSARQLGPMASAGTSAKRDTYTLNDLSYEEREILKRLVELSQSEPQRRASGE